MTERKQNWPAAILAAIGVAVVLFEIFLYGYTAVRNVLGVPGTVWELHHPVLWVGVGLGFVGFFWLDPNKAERGADVVTRSVIALGSFWRRTGARTGDLEKVATVTAIETTITQPVTPTKQDDERGD